MNRREFVKLSALTMGALALSPLRVQAQSTGPAWPDGARLGRVCQGKVSIRSKPNPDAPSVKDIYDDAIVDWQREVVGDAPGYGSRRWVETPDGYIYAPRLQPVFNKPNTLLKDLPVFKNEKGEDEKGFWGEITVPYVDLHIANPPIHTPSMKDIPNPRFYYSQVVWIDDIRTDSNGQSMYRTNQKYGTYGDMFWASADAFRPITAEELSPINPNAENKKIVVNVTRQTLAAFEGQNEVHFCRVSTGAKFDYLGNAVEKWSTPLGPHPIYRKLVSLEMSGQTTGDWPAVPWTCIITGEGVSVHSTYWHNDYGVPRSHGCINASPEDAKWVYRWSYPNIEYNRGELDVSKEWPPVGTIVEVVE